MQEADARLKEPCPKRIDHSECATNHAPRQCIQLGIICVFGVHRLLASALRFLLSDAANKCLQKY
jgi:hypothetical protein